MRKKLLFLLLTATIFASCKKQEIQIPKTQAAPDNKVTTIDSATVKPDSMPVEKSATTNVAGLFKSLKKKPQIFTINTNRDTILNCRENTKITISANSFISQNGSDVLGKVSFQVTEYYNISDMVFAGLSTKNNEKLLETGGMIYITATSEGEECRLKTPIEISFPATKDKPGMELYSGNWQQGQINWQLDKNAADLVKIYSNTDTKAAFPNGNDKFYNFVSKNIILPDETISGKIIVRFIIERDGKISNPQIARSDFKKAVNESVLKIFAKAPSFIPAKMNGVAVRSTFTLPININNGERQASNNAQISTIALNGLEKEMTVKSKIAQVFATLSLNWINCDRLNFDTFEPEKINYAVNLEASQTVMLSFVIFHRYKVVLSGYSTNAGLSFGLLPKNENATLVIVKSEKDKLFLCMQETKINVTPLKNLSFNEVSKENLEYEIKKLNRFN